jgi:hypothetical protein
MPAERRANRCVSVSANRKQLFEAANYLLCQLALQIQELERTTTYVSDEQQPEQQPAQTEEETPE